MSEIKIFNVRIYEPVVTEWKTEFEVPAQSQAEANQIIADLKSSGAGFPEEWVKRQHLVEGTEPIPNIAGNEYWEVSKHVSEDQWGEVEEEEGLNITPDMSNQRAFTWSQYEGAMPQDGSPRYKGPIVFDEIGHSKAIGDVWGMLIAEPCSKPKNSSRTVDKPSDIHPGMDFWSAYHDKTYRILFVFNTPK